MSALDVSTGTHEGLRAALADAIRLNAGVRERYGTAVRQVHSIVSSNHVDVFLAGPLELLEAVRELVPLNAALRVRYLQRRADSRATTRASFARGDAADAPPLGAADFAFLDYLVKKALEPWTRGT